MYFIQILFDFIRYIKVEGKKVLVFTNTKLEKKYANHVSESTTKVNKCWFILCKKLKFRMTRQTANVNSLAIVLTVL